LGYFSRWFVSMKGIPGMNSLVKFVLVLLLLSLPQSVLGGAVADKIEELFPTVLVVGLIIGAIILFEKGTKK
jgi:hypothetical protein